MAVSAADAVRGQSPRLRAGVALLAAAGALVSPAARAAVPVSCPPDPKHLRALEEVDALDATLELCLARLDPVPADQARRGEPGRGVPWLAVGASAALLLAGGAFAARRGVTFRR